jgi:hypothetical protein
VAAAHDLTLDLESIRASYGGFADRQKLALLIALSLKRPVAADALWRLHESLLFLRAYPDSAAVLEAAEHGLLAFAARLRPLARRGAAAFEALDEKGLAGTAVYTSFSLPIARWLVRRYPGQVELYAADEAVTDRLGDALSTLLLPAEAEAVHDRYLGAIEWLRRTAPAPESAAGPGPGSLERILAIVDALGLDERSASSLWTALELPLRWDLGHGDGSRTLLRAPAGDPVWQRRPLARTRLDLLAIAPVGSDRAERPSALAAVAWIDAARAAIAARLREVHTFNHASAEDVTVFDLGDGFRLALFGVEPAARHALRVFYGYLLVKNGVPIGYGDALMMFDWGEINFHIFETFRQAESARVYAAVVAVFRGHFGLRYLFLNRYQFGHHNPDAIRSGAFWFYEKLGFRPRDTALRALWRRERKKIDADPAYRSPDPVLVRLARGPMGIALATPRAALERFYRRFHPMNLGLRATRRIERAHGGDRRAAAAAALRRVRRALGGRWAGAEVAALERLAPALDLIPDLETWPAIERAALGQAVRLKGGASEREHLLATAAHARLRAALVPLG